MGTNRKRRTRAPRQVMPEWAKNLLKTGKKPQKDEPGHGEFIGWMFFDEKIEGLPPAKVVHKKINLFK